MPPKANLTIRLSDAALAIVADAREHLGLNRSAAVELALRRLKEADLAIAHAAGIAENAFFVIPQGDAWVLSRNTKGGFLAESAKIRHEIMGPYDSAEDALLAAREMSIPKTEEDQRWSTDA